MKSIFSIELIIKIILESELSKNKAEINLFSSNNCISLFPNGIENMPREEV